MRSASEMTGSTSRERLPAPKQVAHQFATFLWRTSLVLVLLTVCYYLLPAQAFWQSFPAGGRWAASVLSFGGATLVMRHQLRNARTERSVRARAEAVLTALYLLVLVFAITYDRIAQSQPAQFS